ncbi:MAG: alpha/beta hydrolase [Candidatus Brockarchaeota archaeon]|nr:alpha/beta hydrolase [Candidatus Brockarchaeota archaeon]
MESHEEAYEKARGKIDYVEISKEVKEVVLNRFKIIGYDEDIPGLAVHHPAGPSRKLLLFLHGLGGSKEDVLYFKTFVENFGFSIMAIDARGHGDRKLNPENFKPELLIEYLGKTIVDNRLAIDISFRNHWVEEGKLILTGASMGGILGGVLAGVDKRISGAVLYVPGGDLVEILSKSNVPMLVELRRKVPPELINFVKPLLAPVDPINYIDKVSPRPLLIQLGKHDDIVPFKNGMKLFEKAKEPKQLVVHDSGHALPVDKAVEETVNWLRKNFPQLMV